jgi:predicted transcriptional regulator
MSDKSLFLQVMGDSPINKVLDFLITFKDFDYSLTDICENSEVSWSTLHLFWKDLEKNRIVRQTRVVGKAKMFRLDDSNPVVNELVRMHWLVAKTYTDKLFRKVEVLA